MNLKELLFDCATQQKKGLHFILASIVIWAAVFAVHATALPILTKNLLTFCFTAPLMPLAYLISKIIHVNFTGGSNPLTRLGILFSANQLLYLLIAMWVYPTVPEKMVMVLAMIFGAHLMPFSWLYTSKSYLGFSIAVPLLALIVGLNFPPMWVAGMMIAVEILFSLLLSLEVRQLSQQRAAAG